MAVVEVQRLVRGGDELDGAASTLAVHLVILGVRWKGRTDRGDCREVYSKLFCLLINEALKPRIPREGVPPLWDRQGWYVDQGICRRLPMWWLGMPPVANALAILYRTVLRRSTRTGRFWHYRQHTGMMATLAEARLSLSDQISGLGLT
jgi:hypothetical protein